MIDKKLYLFEFWRNDGQWHSSGHDLSPTLVFEAKDDKEARELAHGYVALNTNHRQDVSLDRLYEIKIKIEQRKLRFRKMKKNGLETFKRPSQKIEEKVDITEFISLEAYIEEHLE